MLVSCAPESEDLRVEQDARHAFFVVARGKDVPAEVGIQMAEKVQDDVAVVADRGQGSSRTPVPAPVHER